MAITQGMQIRQSQNMVMTPQLQQSIKILQYTSLELSNHVAQVIEENPFLEEGVAEGSPQEDNADLASGQDAPVSMIEQEGGLLDKTANDKWSDDSVSSAVYEDTENYYHSAQKSNNYQSDSDPFESVEAKDESLREYITDQVYIDIASAQERIIAFHLIDFLDDSGYFIGDVKDIAGQLKCSENDVEAVLLTLQSFDPAGVFARNLQECLTLQLKDRNRFDPVIGKLLENLDLLAHGDIKKLSRLCKASEEEVKEMCLEVKQLNPKPGNVFAPDAISILQPDVFLKRRPGDQWVVELNSQALPKVLVNRSYYATLAQEIGEKKEDRKYIVEQMSTASWLVRSLNQRAQTILKVATEIVSQQSDFFNKGIRYIKPMVLSDVASEVDLHESTVSRVINGKFMATPMGLYELRYFFSSGVGTKEGQSGDSHSSVAVKHMIKGLVDGESPKKILSDDAIAKQLKDKGVDVARRTVMKYREAMGIPSSVQRRKAKRLR